MLITHTLYIDESKIVSRKAVKQMPQPWGECRHFWDQYKLVKGNKKKFESSLQK